MSSFNKIDKVQYTKKQIDVVSLFEYIIFTDEKNNQKYAVLKLNNNVNQILEELKIEISQYDEEGRLLAKNTINHKVYIGQTTCKRGFRDRYRGSKKLLAIECVYRYNLRSSKSKRRNYNKHLFNSIKKYGFNNFKVNEIFDVAFSKKELDTKEKCWIRYYKSDFEEYGYNITAGGSGKIINNETRKRLKNEQREIYGREIYQLDSKTLNIIKKYKSISEATEELNLSRNSIKNVLNPNYRNITAGGYKWRYVSEQNITYTEEYISKKKKKNNKELVISMYRNGISIHKISEYIGISEKTVKSYLAYEKKQSL